MLKSILMLFILDVVLINGEIYHVRLHQTPLDTPNSYKCIIIEKDPVRQYKGFETTDPNELKIFEKPAVSASPLSNLEREDKSKIIEIFARNLNALESYIDTICTTKETLTSLPAGDACTEKGPSLSR